MANPYDEDYIVPADKAPIEFGGHCYQEGDVIKLKRSELACFREQVFPVYDDKCFPEYCPTEDGWPTDGYRVQVLVPAGGEPVISEVPNIEGCRPPNKVLFHTCGMCIYVDYDTTPLIDPASEVVATGGGADPHPTIRDLTLNGGCIETIHMLNTNDVDVLVTLSYFC